VCKKTPGEAFPFFLRCVQGKAAKRVRAYVMEETASSEAEDADYIASLKKAFERAVVSSRPLPIPEDADDIAALKELEDAEKAGEYLEHLVKTRGDRATARRCANDLGDLDSFGKELPFKLEFYCAILCAEEKDGGAVEMLTKLARKCELQLVEQRLREEKTLMTLRHRRNECLSWIINEHFERKEMRAALNACRRLCATSVKDGDKRTEHAARSKAFRILVASGDVSTARRMLETIDEANIGAQAMVLNRALFCTATGAYDDAFQNLVQGGVGGEAASCAKKICESALLVLKAQPKMALKCILDAMAANPSAYLSHREDVGLAALANTIACYDISPSDSSAKMAFFRFAKANCGANETVGNFILKKQQQQQQQQTVPSNH
jgi:hypothetical protein